MSDSPREFDIVVYGASGFTGRQAAAYLARHAPPGLRWTIAGRNRGRLEAVRESIGGPLAAREPIVADSGDVAAVDAMVGRARIVLATAGPFSRYGTPVVDACVRLGTHYADITGETAWARRLVDRYHDRAAADGTRIVPFCGFDSVPSDLGALLMARHVRSALGVGCAEVRSYFRLAGGLNGGTLQTVVNTIESGEAEGMGDPFLLDPPIAHTPRQVRRSATPVAPHREPALGAWGGPFFMAPTNTRVVRRSAALAAQAGEPYGTEFVYQEYLRYDGAFAPLAATAGTLGIAAALGALRLASLRRRVAGRIPAGTGPSERSMDRGWFTCDLVAVAEDGGIALGSIHHQGDPSNRATVRFLCEAGLAMALDETSLPGGGRRGGVLTPAFALGAVLERRLRAAGVEIEIGMEAGIDPEAQ